MSLPVKEFWKSVNIWGSYEKSLVSLFFLTHRVVYPQLYDGSNADHIAESVNQRSGVTK